LPILAYSEGNKTMPNSDTDRARSIRLTHAELKAVVTETVHETFVKLGVDATDPIEMQKDFQHVRDWRTTTDLIKQKGIVALVVLVVTGVMGLIWVNVVGSPKA
jgi:hypothetical protein